MAEPRAKRRAMFIDRLLSVASTLHETDGSEWVAWARRRLAQGRDGGTADSRIFPRRPATVRTAAAAAAPLGGTTNTGVELPTVVPSPSWPTSLPPQQ